MAGLLVKLAGQRASDLVHPVRADPLSLRHPEQAEDPRSAPVAGQVGRARDDVEMHVRESGRLGELRHVGLLAAGDLMQGPGQPDLPGAQGRRLLVGQLGDSGHVPPGDQHKPAGKSRVEGVRHHPQLVEGDSLMRRQVLEDGAARAAVAASRDHLRHHTPAPPRLLPGG